MRSRKSTTLIVLCCAWSLPEFLHYTLRNDDEKADISTSCASVFDSVSTQWS